MRQIKTYIDTKLKTIKPNLTVFDIHWDIQIRLWDLFNLPVLRQQYNYYTPGEPPIEIIDWFWEGLYETSE